MSSHPESTIAKESSLSTEDYIDNNPRPTCSTITARTEAMPDVLDNSNRTSRINFDTKSRSSQDSSLEVPTTQQLFDAPEDYNVNSVTGSDLDEARNVEIPEDEPVGLLFPPSLGNQANSQSITAVDSFDPVLEQPEAVTPNQQLGIKIEKGLSNPSSQILDSEPGSSRRRRTGESQGTYNRISLKQKLLPEVRDIKNPRLTNEKVSRKAVKVSKKQNTLVHRPVTRSMTNSLGWSKS